MTIESIHVKNFKALRDVQLDNLPQFCVFVGPNGTGKTTLFRVLAFLKNSLAKNVRAALHAEGGRNGLQDVLSRGHKGEDLAIRIAFRWELEGREQSGVYELHIGEDAPGAGPTVKEEWLKDSTSPQFIFKFSQGKGSFLETETFQLPVSIEGHPKVLSLVSPESLALNLFAQLPGFPAASSLHKLIENWHLSDFDLNRARGDKEAGDVQRLSASGDNLPSLALHLHKNHPEIFASIKRRMKELVPGVHEIDVMETPDGRLLVRYADGAFKDPFIDRNVSDGTIKMFAYLVLLSEPKPHPILCVEEPENLLYPKLMTGLAEEFQAYSERGGQVFVATHSPDFLDAVPLESIYWLEKVNGETTVCRAADYPLLQRLIKEGDLPGALWQQGFFDRATMKAG